MPAPILRSGRYAVILFFFTFSIYVLTMGGHTYSPDEETMVYIAESMFSRGALDVPDYQNKPVVGGHIGVGGKFYAATSPGQSLLEIPFFAAGDALARAIAPRFHDYLARLFIGLLNPILTALTVVLLFALTRRMGFSVRACLALALAYALTTMAWVYAKTTFAEPLGALLILATFFAAREHAANPEVASAVWTGALAGASVFGKFQAGLAAPLIVLYMVSSLWDAASPRNSLRRIAKTLLAVALPALLALAVLLWYNYVRFGNALEFGEQSTAGNLAEGISGLLLSPGKSFFLYAPVGLLTLFGLNAFRKRFPREAILIVAILIVFVLFHARLDFWHGDGGWGPRYLMLALPLWLLPSAAVFEKARRWNWAGVLALVTCTLGLAVQLLGVSINFDAYINAQPDQQARFFQPSQSPILGHWRLLSERVEDWWNQTFPGSDGVALVRGFLRSDSNSEELFPRYIANEAQLRVFAPSGEPLHMTFRIMDYRPAQLPRRSVTIHANGSPLEASVSSAADGPAAYFITLPAGHPQALDLQIITEGSAPVGSSPMGDELGLYAENIEARAGEQDLAFFKDISIPPLPVAIPKAEWGWFFFPAFEHLDFWWWYLYFSGLAMWQVAALAAPVMVLSSLTLIISGWGLLRLRI